MLILNGTVNLEIHRALLPDPALRDEPLGWLSPDRARWRQASGISFDAPTAFEWALLDALWDLWAQWEGASYPDLRYKAANTLEGFLEFASNLTSAAAELLDEAGYGSDALPVSSQSVMHTMIQDRERRG